MVLSLRFLLHRRLTGIDAPPPDHLRGELAVAEPGTSFWYGYGAGTGDAAAASHLLFRSDGTRFWHPLIGASDGSTEFVGDGSALTGVVADSVAWSDVTGTPTTLAGYGITDAAPLSHVGAGGAAHANATTSVAGFMSGADKTKLDGVATGATLNFLDANQNVGDSFTLTATAGRTLVIWAGGAHGNTTSAATIDLNYNGAVIATHPIRQGAATSRAGYALVGVVTAVASATCSITVTLGTLYDPKIVWLEIG